MGIGENIRRIRKEKNMTLEQLGKKIGVSKQTVAKYENGVIVKIPYDKIVALADALGVSAADIMGWVSTKADFVGDGFTIEVIQTAEHDQLQKFAGHMSFYEMHLIEKYRQADDITQQMILKLLNIDNDIHNQK